LHKGTYFPIIIQHFSYISMVVLLNMEKVIAILSFFYVSHFIGN